jgi:alpha-beta hydrolase superfamily lysophospholipase
VASALVVAPETPPADPSPLVAWAHGTTGVAEGCAPTLLDDPLGAGAAPAVDQVVARGWTMVATDYVGLGTEGPHPYLVGQGEGRSVLDSIRAVRQLDDLTLDDDTVVWGHSQGGNAALWTGMLADSYAADASVVGVAALAPASDLPGLVANLDVVPGGAIFASYVLRAYADTYPDVELADYVRPAARIQVEEMASRCLAEPEVFVSVISSLVLDGPIWSGDPLDGAFGERLAENVPVGPIPAPLLVAQGGDDPLVLPAAQDDFVRRLCGTGGPLDYRTYPGRDHVGVVADDSDLIPDLMAWTCDRFAGVDAENAC